MRLLQALAALTALSFTIPALAAQKPDRKPQSEVASKAAFATIPAASPDLKKALNAHDLTGAKKLVGREGSVRGTVAKVFAPRSNALAILNFDPDYKKALVAVVKSEDFAKFPNLDTLKDKYVLLKGKFVDYNGAAELLLTNANQIKVVK